MPPTAPLRRPRRGRALALAPVLALLALLAAACGDDIVPTDEVASLDDDGTADESAGGAEDDEVTDAERQDLMLQFAECMRDHGVDMPDPEMTDGGGVAIRAESAAGVDGGPEGGPPSEAQQEEVEAAHEACGHFLEEANADAPELSPEDEARMRDEMLAFAQCMRDNGIDMPDPELDTGGGGMSVQMGGDDGPAGDGVDPESPEFQAARETCSEHFSGDGPVTQAAGPGSAEEDE